MKKLYPDKFPPKKLTTNQLQDFCSVVLKTTGSKCVIVIVVDKEGVMNATSSARSDFGPKNVCETLRNMHEILKSNLTD